MPHITTKKSKNHKKTGCLLMRIPMFHFLVLILKNNTGVMKRWPTVRVSNKQP